MIDNRQKNIKKFINISELAKLLNLKDSKTGKPKTHTLRFWEKQFSILRPVKGSGNRRYYSEKQIENYTFIKFLLKNKGLSIKATKEILKKGINNLDDYHTSSIRADYIGNKIKQKSYSLLEKFKKLKTYGKKNTY